MSISGRKTHGPGKEIKELTKKLNRVSRNLTVLSFSFLLLAAGVLAERLGA